MADFDVDLFGRNQDEPEFIDKERSWKQSRIGYISASELHLLMSPSGIWTEANISYLYKIQRQRRLKQPASPIKARTFTKGRENEPLAVEWLRANFSPHVRHYDQDFDDKPFIGTDFGFGCSPDCDVFVDGEILSIIEIKTVVGEEERGKMFSHTYPYMRKRGRVWNEHKWQVIGQFLAKPEVNTVYVLKYDMVDDDDEFDLRPATHPDRGVMFTFSRDEMGTKLDEAKERITFAHRFIEAGEDPSEINEHYRNKKK